MNLVDSIIGMVSPKTAFNRSRYRLATSTVTDSQRRFDAASHSRRTDGWHSVGTSPNQETQRVLSILRGRSRELVRNNAYAKRAVQAIRNNTIGSGIRPTPYNLSDSEKKQVGEAWWKWAETTACDWNGKETFYGLQKLIISTVAQDGEVIIRRRRMNSKTFIPVKLQVCEADQLDDTIDVPVTTGGGYIMQGVEFDSAGKIIYYWMYDRHPGDSLKMNSERIPASDILHIYLQDRPGQVRGVPWSTSVMVRLKDFDDFEDAQLMQQKISACFAAFVTKDNQDGLNTAADLESSERIEPGIIEHLNPGESVSFATPPSTSGQDAFAKKVLQAIAAGYGITYEALTGDLANVNFSSGRMGWLEMHRNIQEWQQRIMITQFCDPVWNWFVSAAKVAGRIPSDTVVADWTPPRREMIDPTKEINGLNALISNGFDSWQDVVRQLGYDPDLVLEQLSADNSKFDKLGLKLSCDFRNSVMNKSSNTTKNAE